MGRKKKASRQAAASTGAALRRLCFMLLCLAGLAGLLSCRPDSEYVPPRPRNVNALPVSDALAKSQDAPFIRVAVLKAVPRVQIEAGAVEACIFGDKGQEIRRLSPRTGVQVQAGPGGLLVDGSACAARLLRVESITATAALRLNGQSLAPRLIVRQSAEAQLLVVAQMELEEYLLGVLAAETPFERWHPEALKAQGIASRSYAFYQLKKSAAEPYDVESTVMSQLFKAGYRNNGILSAAVNSTRGMVLTCNGEVFPAYFHSTCGGHTDPAAYVFPEQAAVKPLVGVPCMFCRNSPVFRWKMLLDKAALEQKLEAAAAAGAPGVSWPKGAKLLSLEFLDATGAPLASSQRASQVNLRHGGGVVRLPGNEFRLLAGPRGMKSLLIERVVDTGPALEISGGGFGHGVGLCQWGSQGMAEAGYDYAQILGKYYPGAALTRMY